MTDIDDIRSRMHGLTEQECRVLVGEMHQFMIAATTRLLELADRGRRSGTGSWLRSCTTPQSRSTRPNS